MMNKDSLKVYIEQEILKNLPVIAHRIHISDLSKNNEELNIIGKKVAFEKYKPISRSIGNFYKPITRLGHKF